MTEESKKTSDPVVTDLKDLEIQVYNSRPYVHVRRNPGGWLEG